METGAKIRKIMTALFISVVIMMGYGCEIHAHPFTRTHQHHWVYDGYAVYHICDDPELEPFSFAPDSCVEYYDGICCEWEVAYYRYESYCLWDDSCRWEYAGSREY